MVGVAGERFTVDIVRVFKEDSDHAGPFQRKKQSLIVVKMLKTDFFRRDLSIEWASTLNTAWTNGNL